jgi:hypothetical protein
MEQLIKSAESSGKRTERKQNTLDHIEIHPKLGGGHIVKHAYTGYSAEPKEHSFGQKENKSFAAHLAKHTGVPLRLADSAKTETKEGE